MLNRAPEWSRVRAFPYSIGQQVVNPLGLEIQETVQSLIEERYNSFLSTADISIMDRVFEAELPKDLNFIQTDDTDGLSVYKVPTVYAVINGTEEEIIIAENNNIKTFWYDCLPTRIEDGEESYSYNDVVSSAIVDLTSVTPDSIVLPGYLYITITGNTNWEAESKNRRYYSKIILEGTLRKDVEEIKESIPIRYNSTFRTLNQWESIENVVAAYLSDDAQVIISSLPFAADTELDKRNIYIPSTKDERIQFVRLGSQEWGSTLIVDSFTSSDMDTVRLGYEEKEIIYEMELLNDSSNNITLNDIAIQPNTNLVFGIDDNNFYIYDMNLPYPDTSNMVDESADIKMEMASDRWTYIRGETATIQTRILGFMDVPIASRWTITLPDGNSYYMGLDGSLWGMDTDAWLSNPKWESGYWDEANIKFVLTQSGTYTIGLECKYYTERSGEEIIRTIKSLLTVPAIQPEQQLSLPVTLHSCTKLAFDSDGLLWLYDGTDIHKMDIFYDYFMVDYEQRKVFLREQYSEIRVAQ
ncbi:MAG: hypothetical protein KAX49_17230 [Halanaerobiales bacterium]|nr:hypothetical protein [Halanaerobiales bacterium]